MTESPPRTFIPVVKSKADYQRLGGEIVLGYVETAEVKHCPIIVETDKEER